jgi:signal transduction histidine kinase
LSNAVKYGEGKPIEVHIYHAGKFAIIKIKDHGIGISRENQERIFKQFERAVSHHSISGLGLGLYIVKNIVDAHGGKITVSSELGLGSTFAVILPLNQATGSL